MDTGAHRLVEAAVAAGVEVCFANPGTTELDLVHALDEIPGLRPVLGLFEGVCTGAADGYARISGRPALTLTHLGPGLANGLANLHNARRANSPVVNVIGDHASWHLAADAPLTSDIAALAATVGELVTVDDPDQMSDSMFAAFADALRPPGQVVSLVVRQDAAWSNSAVVGSLAPLTARRQVSADHIEQVAAAVRDRRTAVLVDGAGLHEDGVRAVGRLRAQGVTGLSATMPARLDRGRGRPALTRLPYFPDQARSALTGIEVLVLAGARSPVSFFGYPDQPSSLVPDGVEVIELAGIDADLVVALDDLADALDAPTRAPSADTEPPAWSDGPLDVVGLGRVLTGALPEGAVLVDESTTSGGAFASMAHAAAPHTTLGLTGGAIGQGLPVAVGAAIAAPDRPVVALQADGSAAYTAQSLWTMAREDLDVTVVLCDNAAYRILQIEQGRAEVSPGPASQALFDLGAPRIDWVQVAAGWGVPGRRAETNGELEAHLVDAMAEPGPHLIHAVLS